jgi:hypothetical protein
MLVEVRMNANEKRLDERRLLVWKKALMVVRNTVVSVNALFPIKNQEERNDYHKLVVGELKLFVKYGLIYASFGNVDKSNKWAKKEELVQRMGAASNAIWVSLSLTDALQKRLKVIEVLQYINWMIKIIDGIKLQFRINNLRSTQPACAHCGLCQRLYDQHNHGPLLLAAEVALKVTNWS